MTARTVFLKIKGRFIFVLVLATAFLGSGCRNRDDVYEAEGFWPQPFDVALDVSACRKTSSRPCPVAIDEYIDRLRCIELQADAVAIDMILEIVFVPEMFPGSTISKNAADQSRDLIRTFQRDAKEAPFPSACTEVRGAFLDALNKTACLYNGIHRKPRKKIQQDLVASQDAVRHYRALASALQPLPELIRPDPFPPGAEEYINSLRDAHDQPREISSQAVEKYRRMVEDGVAEDDPEMLKVVDEMCPEPPPLPWDATPFYIPELFAHEDIKEWNNLYGLMWVLLGGSYHPFMYDAFVSWRSGTQCGFFGFSNFSEIPNAEYNEVRFIAVRTIQEYLRQHPDDNWARIQKAALLAESNIVRGGLFGNGTIYDSDMTAIKPLFVPPVTNTIIPEEAVP